MDRGRKLNNMSKIKVNSKIINNWWDYYLVKWGIKKSSAGCLGLTSDRLMNRTIRHTIRRTEHKPTRKPSMSSLTANDLKTKGIAAIESILADRPEAIVTVRGKDRFVVMEIAQYHYLRECELEAALAQTHADLTAGKFVKDSPAAHVARVKSAA